MIGYITGATKKRSAVATSQIWPMSRNRTNSVAKISATADEEVQLEEERHEQEPAGLRVEAGDAEEHADHEAVGEEGHRRDEGCRDRTTTGGKAMRLIVGPFETIDGRVALTASIWKVLRTIPIRR